jgi:hypothetical protein
MFNQIKMDEELLSTIKAFIEKEAGKNVDHMRADYTLDDLKIFGDDAVEFIIAFGKEFNVDVSRFMAAEYFAPEGDVILPAIIKFFTGKEKPKRKHLTIHHLIKAIHAGRLDEEVINN